MTSARRSRFRTLRIVAPAALVVLIVAGFAAWRLMQPEIEHSQPTGGEDVVFLGNSFTGGSLMDSGPDSRWPAIVSKHLNLSDTVITADASGYVTPGVGFARYGTLAADVPHNAAAVVILGSDDDASVPQSQITAAAVATLQTIRTRAPHARILAIATFWVSKDVPAGILKSRDAVRAAAKQAGVAFADPIAGHWLVDDPSKTIGVDGLHPTDAGQRELAERIEPLVKSLLSEPAP